MGLRAQARAVSSKTSGLASLSTKPLSSASRADQAWKARAAAPAGMDAELHFGQADLRFGCGRRDAHPARQRQFGAAAHTGTVQCHDRGHLQAGEPLEHPLAVFDRGQYRAIAFVLGEFVQIGADRESGRFCGMDHNSTRALDGDALHDRVQFVQQYPRQRIDFAAHAVHRQHHQAIRFHAGLPMAEPQSLKHAEPHCFRGGGKGGQSCPARPRAPWPPRAGARSMPGTL